MAERRIIATESELKSIVAAMVEAKMAELLAPLVGQPQQVSIAKWLDSGEAEQFLGMNYGELARKRRNGLFVEGVHYRVSNDSPTARSNGVRYEYNVQAVEQRLSEKRSKRKIS